MVGDVAMAKPYPLPVHRSVGRIRPRCAVSIGRMNGSYFLARLAVAVVVPLTLASLGPPQSHPELGTDMAPNKRSSTGVYRADDVRMQAALREYEERERVKLHACRRGRKIHLEPSKR